MTPKIKFSLKKTLQIIFFLGIFTILYATFIERNWINVNEFEIEASFDLNAALISDLHLGFFGKDEDFLERVVDKINVLAKEEKVEILFIAGDFTNVSTEDVDLDQLFDPLKKIDIPVYAVLGNHEEEKPGPKISDKLIKTLWSNKVLISDKNELLFIPNTDIRLVMLGDNWAKKDDITPFLDDLFTGKWKDDNFLVLTHNPDTTWSFPENTNAITLTGHTHGGQIRIPFVYKYVIPCSGDFDWGLINTQKGKIFTSSGLGEVGLPMRLFNPPEIAVLKFRKK
jgi:predicted MPP superfamily phosphohydrolase